MLVYQRVELFFWGCTKPKCITQGWIDITPNKCGMAVLRKPCEGLTIFPDYVHLLLIELKLIGCVDIPMIQHLGCCYLPMFFDLLKMMVLLLKRSIKYSLGNGPF